LFAEVKMNKTVLSRCVGKSMRFGNPHHFRFGEGTGRFAHVVFSVHAAFRTGRITMATAYASDSGKHKRGDLDRFPLIPLFDGTR
jgi:hypothetical protein